MTILLNLTGSGGGTSLNLTDSTPGGNKQTLPHIPALFILNSIAGIIDNTRWSGISIPAIFTLLGNTSSVTEHVVRETVNAFNAYYEEVVETATFRIDKKALGLEIIFPGCYTDGTNIYFYINSIPGITAAEADNVTGDWREILQGMLLAFYNFMETYSVTNNLEACNSFLIQNPNTKKPSLSSLPLWKNTFLFHFNVTYASSQLKEEN